MKAALFILALATAALATRTVPNVPDQAQIIEKNGWTRTELLDPQPFVDLSKRLQADKRDQKVVFEAAALGFAFKAENDDDNSVCLRECEDDIENCFTIDDSCDDTCDNCVRVFTCEDREKHRCLAMKEAPCLKGDFQCIPSNVGVRIKKEKKNGKKARKGLTKKGLFSLFKREKCAEGFNLLPCNPKTDRCQAFEPCESDNMGCCEFAGLV
eukprot:TRINITY_DN17428_c0_g1_i1.p1 TRINITY_DN17428_c0_g1~~TRINITY_DN17428_c0_g1_i1.p1  ORF type:complete len:212 (+),score=56.75 TRINITY_DN17428_c0_g1_i1:181-816(+)